MKGVYWGEGVIYLGEVRHPHPLRGGLVKRGGSRLKISGGMDHTSLTQWSTRWRIFLPPVPPPYPAGGVLCIGKIPQSSSGPVLEGWVRGWP